MLASRSLIRRFSDSSLALSVPVENTFGSAQTAELHKLRRLQQCQKILDRAYCVAVVAAVFFFKKKTRHAGCLLTFTFSLFACVGVCGPDSFESAVNMLKLADMNVRMGQYAAAVVVPLVWYRLRSCVVLLILLLLALSLDTHAPTNSCRRGAPRS